MDLGTKSVVGRFNRHFSYGSKAASRMFSGAGSQVVSPSEDAENNSTTNKSTKELVMITIEPKVAELEGIPSRPFGVQSLRKVALLEIQSPLIHIYMHMLYIDFGSCYMN